MTAPSPYREWKRRRAASSPPADFADRVMARIRQAGPATPGAPPQAPSGTLWRRLSPVAAAAAIVVGFVLGALRLAAIVQLIVGFPAEGV
jgi:hypothetical protein